MELKTKDSSGIKSFINILTVYGNEVSLIKHRPNKEKYPSGKAQEPLIKISLNSFTKRIESKLRENHNYSKKLKNAQKEVKFAVNSDNSPKNEKPINEEIKQEEKKNEIIDEDIDKEITGNSSVSLSNIINMNSLKLIKYFDFLIYLFVNIILIVEFILTYRFFSNHTQRYSYFK